MTLYGIMSVNENMTLNFGLTNTNTRIETPGEDSKGNVSGTLGDQMSTMQEDRNLEIQNIIAPEGSYCARALFFLFVHKMSSKFPCFGSAKMIHYAAKRIENR